MTRFAANLLAGVTFITFTGAANATEPGQHSATPEILSSVNFASYKSLSDIEMAEVAGGIIPPGIYNIVGSNPNGTSYTGTANISLLDQIKSLYYITYVTSDRPQTPQQVAAFEYNNVLSLVTTFGTDNQSSLIVYVLHPDGSLSGRRWTSPDFAFSTETLTIARSAATR